MKFIKWMGTRTKLANGQVIGWITIGFSIGCIAGMLFLAGLL